MPKQDSIFKIVGTIDDITFYKHHGKHFCKKKRAYPENFHTNPSFTVFRMRNKFYTKSVKLAGCIYTVFPQKMRNYKCWSRLLKFVFRSVMNEVSIADIFSRVLKEFDLITYRTPDPDVNQILHTIYKKALSKNLLLIIEEDIPYIHNPFHLTSSSLPLTSRSLPARPPTLQFVCCIPASFRIVPTPASGNHPRIEAQPVVHKALQSKNTKFENAN